MKDFGKHLHDSVKMSNLPIWHASSLRVAPDGKETEVLGRRNIAGKIIPDHPDFMCAQRKALQSYEKKTWIRFGDPHLLFNPDGIKQGGQAMLGDLLTLIPGVAIAEQGKTEATVSQGLQRFVRERS